MSEHVSVYITCPDDATAARIARELIERRLAACANLFPIRSLYRWQGAIQDEGEVAMLLKTRRALVPEIERAVNAIHPYDVPCIVAFELAGGLPAYLSWVDDETTSVSDDARGSRS